MKLSSILLIAGLVLLAVLAVWWDWSILSKIGFNLPAIGWIALSLGVLVTVLVGGGLMFLLFWSSRHGYDDIEQRIDGDESERDLTR